MVARIFISYSRRDEAFARRLGGSLSQMGADIWMDVDDIPVGMNWSSAIQQGLDVSELMILVLSPDSMASHNVANEWQFYLDNHKLIVPVLAHPTQVHFQLNRIQYVDFHGQSYGRALGQLITKLTQQGVRLNVPPNLRNVPLPSTPHLDSVKGHRRGRGLLIAGGLATLVVVIALALAVVAMLPTLGGSGRDATAISTATSKLNTPLTATSNNAALMVIAQERAAVVPLIEGREELDYVMSREWRLNGYVVRLWEENEFKTVVLTIDSADQPRITHLSFRDNTTFDNLIGGDLNGDTYPDVVFEEDPAAAVGTGCKMHMYSLGPTMAKILETSAFMYCGSEFRDLDSDGAYEYIARDAAFRSEFCNGAESPGVDGILKYDTMQRRYLPAGSQFIHHYDVEIAQFNITPELVSASYSSGDIERAKCLALAPVLNYLYSGRLVEAWEELNRLYPYPDVNEFHYDILIIAEGSDLYRP